MDKEEPRSPTGAEQRILELLVSPDYLGVEAFREQIRTAKVQTNCACGCGSFTIITDPSASVPAEYVGMTPSAMDHDLAVDAFMFVQAGRLVGAEITYYDGRSLGVPDASTFDFN